MANPQRVLAEVTEIVDHGDSVYTISFKSEKKLPSFKAGQFLHLALDEFDPSSGFWPESRVFSIASAPSPYEVVISYSVKGVFTTRMQREMAVGKSFWLKFPYGEFVISEIAGDDDSVVLVAGGTGITPFVAFLERHCQDEISRKVTLYYGVRKPELLLYSELIGRCLSGPKSIGINIFLETGSTNFKFKNGRIDIPAIRAAALADNRVKVFLAGPPVMMDAVKKDLSSHGIADDRILIDEWE